MSDKLWHVAEFGGRYWLVSPSGNVIGDSYRRRRAAESFARQMNAHDERRAKDAGKEQRRRAENRAIAQFLAEWGDQ